MVVVCIGVVRARVRVRVRVVHSLDTSAAAGGDASSSAAVVDTQAEEVERHSSQLEAAVAVEHSDHHRTGDSRPVEELHSRPVVVLQGCRRTAEGSPRLHSPAHSVAVAAGTSSWCRAV